MKRETHQSYREKMLDSRWRDFCIAVMNQPKFQNGDLLGAFCENCESRERLQVHHLGYRENAEPWEYGFTEVMVLCHACHSEIHDYADRLWNDVLACRNMWLIYEAGKAARHEIARHECQESKSA